MEINSFIQILNLLKSKYKGCHICPLKNSIDILICDNELIIQQSHISKKENSTIIKIEPVALDKLFNEKCMEIFPLLPDNPPVGYYWSDEEWKKVI